MSTGSDKGGRFSMVGIKSKMTAFAFFATLLPTLALGWLYYSNNRNLLEEKITQGLTNSADNLGGEVGRWLLERQHELRVFAASYVVAENLRPAVAGDSQATGMIGDYLQSVTSMVPDLDALAVTDPGGEIVVASDQAKVWPIPAAWPTALAENQQALGEPQFDPGRERFLLLQGTLLADLNQQPAGLLVARLHFDRVGAILRQTGSGGESAYLIDGMGRIVAAGRAGGMALGDQLSSSLRDRLDPGRIAEFWHQDGSAAVGTVAPIDGSDWLIVVEQPSMVAFAGVHELERMTLFLGMIFVLGMSLIAYVFAHGMAAPLKRLTDGAARVAEGDMDVDLPVRGRDEIAYLTRVFGNMVQRLIAGRAELDQINTRLREQNEKLQILSSTDPLTGLRNRQDLNAHLSELIERSEQQQKPFALLMMDLDHFKRLNDDYGHLAGDRALKLIADELRVILRDDDYAARFGGEEFLVLLPEAAEKTALAVAERLRSGIEKHVIDLNGKQVRVTLSIGVAIYPEAGTDVDAIIHSADEALYQAKTEGRNRVVSFTATRAEATEAPAAEVPEPAEEPAVEAAEASDKSGEPERVERRRVPS